MWYESEWTEKKGTTFEKHMFLTRWTKSCSLHRTSERQENCSFASVILFGVQFSMMSFDFSGTFALLSRSLFFSRCRCCSTKLCRNLYQFLSNNGTKCLHKRSYDWNGHWRWLMYFEFHLKKKTNECTVLRSDFICKYFQFEKWLFLSLLSVQNEFWARNEGKIWNILNA